MIEADLRRLRQRRRSIAKPRLMHLIGWAGYHAMSRYTGAHVTDGWVGQPFTDDVQRACEHAVAEELYTLADRRVFLFFGIRNRLDLDLARVVGVFIDRATGDAATRTEPIADYILGGGRVGEGWLDARSVGMSDLS